MTLTAAFNIDFPGNAAEAFAFYESIFGGRLDITRYGDLELSGMPFDPPADAVAHAQLTTEGFSLCGGDSMADTPPVLESDVYSFMLAPESVEAARDLIERLKAEGGAVVMPFEKAPWGDFYGQVRDRFGVLWHLNVPAE